MPNGRGLGTSEDPGKREVHKGWGFFLMTVQTALGRNRQGAYREGTGTGFLLNDGANRVRKKPPECGFALARAGSS